MACSNRARALIAKLKGATAGRLLLAYLLFRQIFAALGLTSVAGHPQTVRPLVAQWRRPRPSRATRISTSRPASE
jgi:uncharacterized membrane protein